MAAPKTVKSLLASVGGQIQLSSPQGLWMQRSTNRLLTFFSDTYVGDGSSPRFIQVGHGFKAKSLFVFSPVAVGIKIDIMPGDLAFLGSGMGPAIELTETGFIIVAAAVVPLNDVGETYYFQAQR